MTRQPGLLAAVGIDASALLDFKDSSRASLNAQRTMTTSLEGLGILEARNSDDLVELFEAITELSPDARTLWARTLSALDGVNRIRRANVTETSRQVAQRTPLPLDVRGEVDVLVVSDRAGQAQGVPDHPGYIARTNEPELAYLDAFTHCSTAQAVLGLRDRGNFPKGAPREVIWQAILEPLAKISAEATLLDRFFLTKSSGDHARWLVSKLDRSLCEGAHLRVLGEWDPSWSEGKARDVARQRVAPHIGSGRIASAEVVLAASWDNNNTRPANRRPANTPYGPHNRHLRFSCGMAVTSVEGFDHLRSHRVAGVDGFTWILESSAVRLADLGRSESVVVAQPKQVLVQLP